jgi:glycosyltransferase involved in cell wall biosynthesis
MSPSRDIRVLAMVEAKSISGSAKAVLEFAREAVADHSASGKIQLSAMTFSRSQEENSLTQAFQSLGIELNVVKERGAFDLSIIPQLRSLVENLHPDVIWSNSVKSHFLVRFAGLSRSAKWIAFHHGYTAEDMKVLLYNQLDRWSLRAADRVITVCRPFAAELQSRGISPNRIHIQHMPIRPFQPIASEQVASLRTQLAISDDVSVLLSVGRLSFEKGHADLIRAFHALRQQKPCMPVHLVLVGDGPERSNLCSLCQRFELSAYVTLVGHQEDVRHYYAMADAFVLPSRSEGSPNVLLEAMSMGLPVVATSVGGIPELVRHGNDALLVDKGNVGALTAALSRVLEDKTLYGRLKGAGPKSILRHTTEAYYRGIAKVFEEAVCH